MHTWYSAAPRPPIMVPKKTERKVKGGSSSSLRSTRYLETSLPLVMTGSPLTKIGPSSSLASDDDLSGSNASSFSSSVVPTYAASSLWEVSVLDKTGVGCSTAITGSPRGNQMLLGEARVVGTILAGPPFNLFSSLHEAHHVGFEEICAISADKCSQPMLKDMEMSV